MTDFCGPFNSGGGASFDETIWREMFGNLLSDGVIKGKLNQFAVTAPGGMFVAVDTGYAVGDGVFFSSTASTTLAIATSDPSNPRIDLVVVHIDLVARTGVRQVLTGTPAGSPSIPGTTNNSSVWEVPLAQVLVGAGVAGIVAGNITQDSILGPLGSGARKWASTQHAHMSFFSGSVVGTGPTSINHGLGETPNYIVVSSSGSTPSMFACTNQNATTVDVRSSVGGATFFGMAARFP